MLYIIGLGLDKKDISLNALEAIKKCDKIYFENYTTVFPYTTKELESVIKRKVIPADRKMVEEKSEIVDEAVKKKVALLVYGDPLAATTHVDIIMRAKKKRVKVKVIHAPSIITAVAESGMQLYKFGKTASIAKWQMPSFRPESFYDVVVNNLQNNAHTLLLLDIGLSIKEALSYLESMSRMKDPNIAGWDFIVCEKMGTDKQKITFGKIDDLMKMKFSLPACLIVPANMHFAEREMLDTWKAPERSGNKIKKKK